jgi:hypothetical protein
MNAAKTTPKLRDWEPIAEFGLAAPLLFGARSSKLHKE